MESFGLIPFHEAPAPKLGQRFADRATERDGDGSAPDVRRAVCTGCGDTYGVPPGLLPPWGGRVRCPRCAHEFFVGTVAEAERMILALRDGDPERWRQACESRALWKEWGEPLLDAYESLRAKFGPPSASRAFRRALETVAPSVPWLAPPVEPSPLETVPEAIGETLFERRRVP